MKLQSGGVYWWYPKKFIKVQIHHPRWYRWKNDYFVMAPSVLRMMCGSPNDSFPERIDYGFGLVLLGFGVAVSWSRNKAGDLLDA